MSDIPPGTKKSLLELRDKNRALLIIAVVAVVLLAFSLGVDLGKSFEDSNLGWPPHSTSPAPTFGALAGIGLCIALAFLGMASMYVACCTRGLSVRIDYRATDDEREILAKAEARRIRDRIEADRLVPDETEGPR